MLFKHFYHYIAIAMLLVHTYCDFTIAKEPNTKCSNKIGGVERGHDQGHGHDHDQCPPPVNPCLAFGEDINQCIATPRCSYCTQPDYCSSTSRCDFSTNLQDSGCPDESIVDSVTLSATIIPGEQNDPINVYLYPGTAVNFTLTFTNIDKHEWDILLLADASPSFRPKLDSFASAQVSGFMDLINTGFPSNSRLGYASFSDKPVAPMGNPTLGYSFKLHRPLRPIPEAEEFETFILATEDGGEGTEVTTREAVADAWLQGSTCAGLVDWRPNTQRIIISMAEDGPHQDGDGLQGQPPVVTPYPGGCEANGQGLYLGDQYDYASPTQVGSAINENFIHLWMPVFPLDPTTYGYYYPFLVKIFTQFLYFSGFDDVVARFSQIRTSIQRTFVFWTEDLVSPLPELTYRIFTNCDGPDLIEKNYCYEDAPENGTVTFVLEISLAGCPASSEDFFKQILLNQYGFSGFNQVLKLNLICENCVGKSRSINLGEK